MPQNKFSSSVDEIMENLKKQQNERPSSDQLVEDILADLGRGPAQDLSYRKSAYEPEKSLLDEAEQPAQQEDWAAQLHSEETDFETEYPPQPEQEPQPTRRSMKRREPVAPSPVQPQETAGSGRITFADPGAQQENHRELNAGPEARKALTYPTQQPHRAAPTPPPQDVKAPSLSATVQFDKEFQKFFSESVAVIPEEQPEQHPGFFARLMQRRKDADEDFYEEDEDDLLMPDPADQQVEPTLMVPQAAKPDDTSSASARHPEEEVGEIDLFAGAFEQPVPALQPQVPEYESEPVFAAEQPEFVPEFKPEKQEEPEAAPEPEYEPETELEYEPETEPETELETEPEPEPEYEPEAEPEYELETELEYEPEDTESFDQGLEQPEEDAFDQTLEPEYEPEEPENSEAEEPWDQEPTVAISLDDAAGPVPMSAAASAAETLYGDGGEEEYEEEEPRHGFRFPKLFGKEEPEEEAFEEEEASRYIEDYEDPEDAPDVESHLGRMRAGFVLRTAVSGILSLLLLYLGLAVGESALPPIPVLDPALSPAAWLTVQLVLLVVVCAVNWRVFAKGLPGIWSTPTQDTIPALASLAAVFQLGYSLVQAESFDPAAVTLFAAPAAILLAFNALGRLLMSGVVLRGFQLVSAGNDHTVAALVQDRKLLEGITKDMDEPDPCLLANRPTSLVQGYLRRSFSVRASDATAQKLSWALLGGAMVSAMICAFGGKGLGMSITAFAGTLCLGAPLAATLLSAVPAMLMQKSAARVGAVIPGWSAVSQLGRANMVVAGAKDLFPASSVRLHGIKTFEKQRIDLAILYAASILVEGCDTLRDVFLNIIQNRTDILYPVENLENHPGLGFTGWVDNNRMIIGNRDMMAEQGVEIPSLDYENRYTKGKRQPIYLAVSGRVFAMFIVSYRANSQVAETLETLHRQGVSVLLYSDDFCLNTAMAAQVYGLSEGCIKVLSRAERKVLEPYTGYTPKAEGCMAHLGSFASFVGGLTAAVGAASGERAASLVQMAGVALSCVMALLLSFTGGIAQLSLAAVLLYGLAWGVLTLAMPLFRNY